MISMNCVRELRVEVGKNFYFHHTFHLRNLNTIITFLSYLSREYDVFGALNSVFCLLESHIPFNSL